MFARLPLLITVAVVLAVGGLLSLFRALDRTAPRPAVPVRVRATSSPTDADERPEVARLIVRDLKRDFGAPFGEPKKWGADWFRDIAGVSVNLATARVRTRLARGKNGTRRAVALCRVVSGWMFERDNEGYGLNKVDVFDRNGRRLVGRSGFADSCGP